MLGYGIEGGEEINIGLVRQALRAEPMAEPDTSAILEVKALVANEANGDDGHGLQDEDVLENLQVDSQQVVEEESGCAHYAYGHGDGGKLAHGQAEDDLLPVIVDFLWYACL